MHYDDGKKQLKELGKITSYLRYKKSSRDVNTFMSHRTLEKATV